MVDQISEDKFEDKVIKSDKPVIVDFYADWCGPCKMMAPVMEELSEEYGSKMSFFKCDVDANGGIAQKYNIMSIPAIFIFQNGEIIKKFVGAQSRKSLEDAISRV